MGATAWSRHPDGQRRICHPGAKSHAVVGDHVMWQAAPGQAKKAPSKGQERRNLFTARMRSAPSFAANIDQVLILIAAEPVFSEASWPAH